MMEFSQEAVCRRIAQVRLETAGPRGKSAFAKQLGISASTYDYYESARVPPAEIFVRIAEVAGVDLRWLLTGQAATGPGATVGADHPIVQRAAALLSQSPSSAAPLAAFLDILAESAKFPAKPAESPPAGALQTPVPEPAAGQRPDASRQSWIPVLGRSAAGVPQFWSDTDDTSALTTLDDLIARHTGGATQTRSAHATDAAGTSTPDVQMITLTAPEGDVAEFVACADLKTRYADAFALRIDGDSMSPEIAHGDLVVLSPSVPAADGRAAVVQLAGQIGVTCKLFRREGTRVHLVPINEQLDPLAVDAAHIVWAFRVLAKIRSRN